MTDFGGKQPFISNNAGLQGLEQRCAQQRMRCWRAPGPPTFHFMQPSRLLVRQPRNRARQEAGPHLWASDWPQMPQNCGPSYKSRFALRLLRCTWIHLTTRSRRTHLPPPPSSRGSIKPTKSTANSLSSLLDPNPDIHCLLPPSPAVQEVKRGIYCPDRQAKAAEASRSTSQITRSTT